MKSETAALLFAGLSLVQAPLWAASPEDILKTAWKDPQIANQQEAVRLAKDASSLNPLEKADIRFDRGELNQQDVKVGLRLYPKGYSEHVASSRFQRALEKNEEAALSEALSKMLVARYDLIARLTLAKEKKAMADQLSQVSRRASKALSYAAQKSRTELKSYLKAKTDLDKIDLKIADIQRDYSNTQSELSDLQLGGIDQFDLTDLASIDDIRTKFDGAADKRLEQTLTNQVVLADLEKSQSALQYDRARDEKWLEHIEVSMKDDKGEKVYGVEVAINLPFAGAPDLSAVDKRIKMLRERNKSREATALSDREYKNTVTELRTLLDLHKSMRETSRMNPDELRRASSAIAGQDPMLALDLQRGWLESREHLLDLEFRIRALYIKYLHESSSIASAPESNHLSKTAKRIL